MTPLLQPVTRHTAPEASGPALERVQKQYGYIPNLLATLANSPTALQSYLALEATWNDGSLLPSERQLVLLTASVANGCAYCEAAHAAGATMLGVDEAVVHAIRGAREVPDARLAALASLTRELVLGRGHAAPTTIEAFLSAGYTAPQLLEVIVGIALKTISNYLNHVNPVELDGRLRAFQRVA